MGQTMSQGTQAVRVIPQQLEGDLGTVLVSRPDPRSQYPAFRRHYEAAPEQKWQITVLSKILDYTNLEPNWDTYGSPPLKWDAGLFALNVLNQVMLRRTPVPQVVPTPGGGVQVEWHDRQIDIELHVKGPYDCELLVEDKRSGHTQSEELSSDFSRLQDAIKILTMR
jgi:hypothetical protein